MPARILLAAAMLVAGAWFVVVEGGARAQDELTALAFRASPPPTAADVTRAAALAERARRLNPDVRPEVLRGVVELRAGRARVAGARFRAAAHREPLNVEPWALLAEAAKHYDPALAARARARVAMLSPPVPAP